MVTKIKFEVDNKKLAVNAFFALALAHLIAVAAGWEMVGYATKPFLMASLAGWFWLETGLRSAFSRLFFAGLLFSMLGDSLLMLVKPLGESFFLLGLLAFLTAHVLYLLGFLKYPRLREGMAWQRPWICLLLAAYLISFGYYLWPDLPGFFKWPVMVYATVITAMAATAVNMGSRVGARIFGHIATGAVLFVLSDSIIALRKFKFATWEDPWPGLAIMITYILGQYLLAKGSALANKN